MDIHVNDRVKLRKEHPCGSREWIVLRTGMDFRLRCCGCGHMILVPRRTVEKNIRSLVRDGEEINARDLNG